MIGIICFFSGIYIMVILYTVQKTLNDPYIHRLENEIISDTYHLNQVNTELRIFNSQYSTINEWMTWAILYQDFRKKYPDEADKWMESYVGLNWPRDCR